MASNTNKDSEVVHDHFWVGYETLETVSLFSTNGAARILRCLLEGKKTGKLPFLLPRIGPARDSRQIASLCMRLSFTRWVSDFLSLPSK